MNINMNRWCCRQFTLGTVSIWVFCLYHKCKQCKQQFTNTRRKVPFRASSRWQNGRGAFGRKNDSSLARGPYSFEETNHLPLLYLLSRARVPKWGQVNWVKCGKLNGEEENKSHNKYTCKCVHVSIMYIVPVSAMKHVIHTIWVCRNSLVTERIHTRKKETNRIEIEC